MYWNQNPDEAVIKPFQSSFCEIQKRKKNGLPETDKPQMVSLK
jgi:hypothetical protein